MKTNIVTQENFAQAERFAGTVLLDFWAGWCGPCRAMAPVVDELAQARPDVFVGKVDVDAESELARRFNILSIPTFVVLRDGKEVARTAGMRPRAALEALL